MQALTFDQRLAIAAIILGVLAFLVGLGVTLAMDAKTKGEFRFAVGCFILSASMLCFTVGVWQVTTSSIWYQRFLISGCCFALVGVLLVEGIRWTQGRHLHASALPPSPVPPAPPLNSETHGTTDTVKAKPEHSQAPLNTKELANEIAGKLRSGWSAKNIPYGKRYAWEVQRKRGATTYSFQH